MGKAIKFGTDGWRAVIADQYTFENLARVADATASWIIEKKPAENGVVIGYDSRFLSSDFARFTARVIASRGLHVRICDEITPTPAVSWAAREFNAIGVVITASHNPPEYNGFKIKAPYGGSALQSQIQELETYIQSETDISDLEPFDNLMNSGKIEVIDLNAIYLDALRAGIDLDAIRKSEGLIAHDAMFGATASLLPQLLGEQVFVLNDDHNPGFHGVPPEPIEKNLPDLPELIRSQNCMLGIANDGDGDRVAMFDEAGNYVDSHQILCLLAKYMFEERGMKGDIIKTFSTTDMLRKQAETYGIPIHTTPIGFKYIAEKLLSGDVMVCGEESGGIAVKGHIPERDGLFIGLLVAEMCAKRGRKLSELVLELFDEFGGHYNHRNDLHTTEARKNAMITYCNAEKLTEIAGVKVVRREFLDGSKHWLEDGSWLLVRPSGTEPVLRIYSEAPTMELAKSFVDFVSDMVESDIIFNT